MAKQAPGNPIEQFIEVWGVGDLPDNVHLELFTCTEVEALCALFEHLGRPDLAELWRVAHGATDDEIDQHYGYGQDA